jgi:hypothetical protein
MPEYKYYKFSYVLYKVEFHRHNRFNMKLHPCKAYTYRSNMGWTESTLSPFYITSHYDELSEDELFLELV